METHMHSPENNEPNSVDQFTTIVDELDIKPETTHENQTELFNEIRRRHDAARQEANITRVAIDRLPLEAIGTGAGITLRRVKPDPQTERLFLRISYPVKSESSDTPVTHNIFLTIGERSEGTVVESGEFTIEQANLVFNQADELTNLRDEGFLPDLSADLGNIFNLNTAITMYHPPNSAE